MLPDTPFDEFRLENTPLRVCKPATDTARDCTYVLVYYQRSYSRVDTMKALTQARLLVWDVSAAVTWWDILQPGHYLSLSIL